MKLYKITLCWFLIIPAAAAFAENSVIVKSRTVLTGGAADTVAVYITNGVPIEGIVIPLELRLLEGSGFITTALTAVKQNRLSGMTYAVSDVLPDKDNTTWYKCDGTGYKTRDTTDVFVSPEGLFFGAVNGVGADPVGSGYDAEGQPSLIITFVASNAQGKFIIDTTCVTPDNHLSFYASDRTLITPSFTPGIVTICDCPCWADPNCDGIRSDVLDVVNAVGVAFRGQAGSADPNCPYRRYDVNADGVSDVLDVVRAVNAAFTGYSIASQYVDLCD